MRIPMGESQEYHYKKPKGDPKGKEILVWGKDPRKKSAKKKRKKSAKIERRMPGERHVDLQDPRDEFDTSPAMLVEDPGDVGPVLEQEFRKAWRYRDASYFRKLIYELEKDPSEGSTQHRCYLWIFNRMHNVEGEFKPGKKELAKLLKEAGFIGSKNTISRAVKKARYTYPGDPGDPR